MSVSDSFVVAVAGAAWLPPPGRGCGRTCLGPVDPTRLPLGQAFGLARSARRVGVGVEMSPLPSLALARFDPHPSLPPARGKEQYQQVLGMGNP